MKADILHICQIKIRVEIKEDLVPDLHDPPGKCLDFYLRILMSTQTRN